MGVVGHRPAGVAQGLAERGVGRDAGPYSTGGLVCIVCNVPALHDHKIDVVGDYAMAQKWMRRAAESMLFCAKNATDRYQAQSYDRCHKEMVRLIRAWNEVEHHRELESPKTRPLPRVIPTPPSRRIW